MKKFLLSAAAIALAAGAYAQVENGTYYIHNVGQDTWLNSGQSWGTAIVTSPLPRAFELINQDGGGCLVKSSIGYWKNDDLYADGNEGQAGAYEFEKNGDIYYIKYNGKYVALNEKFDFLNGDWWNWEKACHQDTQWSLKYVDSVDAAEKWELLTFEDMKKNLEKASAENPVNATFFVKANNFSKNDTENLTAWQCTMNGEQASIVVPDPCWIYDETADAHWAHQDTYGWFINDKHENELTDSEDVVWQDAEGLPEGDYNLVYRVVNMANTDFELNVNGVKCDVVAHNPEDSDLWYHSASADMKTGEKNVDIKVAADGKLSIKMTKQSKAGQKNRFAFKTFRLYYKGNPAGSGVAEMELDENAPVEYYNLQGLRVANPEKGIYIVRQGNKVSKRVIR